MTTTNQQALDDLHLDASGEARLYGELSNLWHPVAYSSALAAGGPIPATLLGEPLALVRLGGRVRAFRDLCAHRGTAICSANREQPEVPDHAVARTGAELRFGEADAFGEVPAVGLEGRSKSADGLPHKTGTVLADKAYRVFMPFTVWLQQRLPGGKNYQLFTTISPTGPKSCRSFTFMARDYDLDEAEDQKFVSFNDTIIGQDQPLVESQRPEELPVDLSAEVQIRGADLVAVEYRRWLREIAYDSPRPGPKSRRRGTDKRREETS